MTTVNIPYAARAAIDAQKVARNGTSFCPDADFTTSIQEETNRILLLRPKAWSFASPITAVPAAGGASRARWRFFCHTSSLHDYMLVRYIVAPTNSTSGPSARTDFVVSGGSSTGIADFAFGNNSTGLTDVPANFGIGTVRTLESGTTLPVSLTADTDYEVTVSDLFDCRILSVCVMEVMKTPDTDNGYISSGVQTGSPIYNSHRSAMIPNLRTAWKRNAAPLITWASNTDATAPATSNLTRNLLDTTVQSVSAASPGFTIDTRLRSSVRRAASGVPCIMRAYCKTSTGTASVLLKDSTGATVATCSTSSSSASWVSSGLFYLPESLAKYDLMQTATVQTTTTYAVSVYQYEA